MKWSSKILLALLAMVGLLLMGFVGMNGPPFDWTSLSWADFLGWIVTPSGVSILAGIVLSRVIEVYWAAYHEYTKDLKTLIFFGLSLLIPLTGAMLGILSLGWPYTWAVTFWPAIMAGISAGGMGTVAHAILPHKKR